MVFSSSTFLFAFLPVFFCAYYLTPWRPIRNSWLLIASLIFYAWGEPVYVLLLLASILFNWLFALAMDNNDALLRRKLWLTLDVLFNITLIGFFKYEGFLAENVNALLGSSVIPDLELPLPIGISFYTLQALSYAIDVYRGRAKPQRNILYLGMYIACFPQLVAGPIVRYETIKEQIVDRRETVADFTSGLSLFIVGLAKKALLANNVAILANQMLEMGGASIGAIGSWGGLIAYTFQIYFDFSGYSDMAIGLGRMMGFRYLRNFNYPYISKTVTEFWRRWHISLSTFFRDYVYIPLGGSRVSTARNILNIAIVWAITGLWHGAAWNYVLWGVYYGALLICEKYVWRETLKKLPHVVQHLYCIAIFVFGWSFFWITDASQLFEYWKAMAGLYGFTGNASFFQLSVWQYWPLFLICAIATTPICPWAKERLISWLEDRRPTSVLKTGIANARCHDASALCSLIAQPTDKQKSVAYYVVSMAYGLALIIILTTSIASIVSGSFNPFIYFQF